MATPSQNSITLSPNLLCPPLYDRRDFLAPHLFGARSRRLRKSLVALTLVAFRLALLEDDAVVHRERAQGVPPGECGT